MGDGGTPDSPAPCRAAVGTRRCVAGIDLESHIREQGSPVVCREGPQLTGEGVDGLQGPCAAAGQNPVTGGQAFAAKEARAY